MAAVTSISPQASPISSPPSINEALLPEIIFAIFVHLDSLALSKASQTCHFWHQNITDQVWDRVISNELQEKNYYILSPAKWNRYFGEVAHVPFPRSLIQQFDKRNERIAKLVEEKVRLQMDKDKCIQRLPNEEKEKIRLQKTETARERSFAFYIPQAVNGEPTTRKLIEKLVNKPKEGSKTAYHISQTFPRIEEKETNYPSGWYFGTETNLLENNKVHLENVNQFIQEQMPNSRIATLFEITTAMLTRHVETEEYLPLRNKDIPLHSLCKNGDTYAVASMSDLGLVAKTCRNTVRKTVPVYTGFMVFEQIVHPQAWASSLPK